MSVDQQILVDGHLKKQLLNDFAESPDSFDDDIVEEIWRHLDVCEGCMEDYETIRDGDFKDKETPGEPTEPTGEPHVEGIEHDGFEPDEIDDAAVVADKHDDDHINGLMPVGDDPTRNGVPDEYSDDQAQAIEIESPGETVSSAKAETDKSGENEDPEESSAENKKDKAEVIEGLITGKITPSKETAERVETESLAEGEVRTSRERIQASMLKEVVVDPEPSGSPTDEKEVEPVSAEEREQAAESSLDAGTDTEDTTESPEAEDHKPEVDMESARPAKPVLKPKTKTRDSQPSKPARPHPPVAAKQEPLEVFFSGVGLFLKRPRNAIICGVAVVALVAAILYFLNVFGPAQELESPVAGWEPLNIIETRVPLQEVIIRKMRKGVIPPARGLDTTLDFRGINRLVIAVDLDFIKGKTVPHEAIVRNPAGEIVFLETIPQIYLDDGRFFLRLLPKLFETGETYSLELATSSADGTSRVIARSVFDVLK